MKGDAKEFDDKVAFLKGNIPTSLDPAQDALNRMRRANQRGSGCRLTAEMIASLSLTLIGKMWSDDDPRNDSH